MFGESSVQVVYSRHTDAAAAVRRCADQIKAENLPPRLVIAFCGGKHPPQPVLDCIRSELGHCPVVGGAAAGAIAREGFGYSGFELVLGVFSSHDITPRCVATHSLQAGESEAGRNLGRQVGEIASDGAVVMLFYDSIAAVAPLRLHPAAPLVNGFYEGLGDREIHLVGGGLLTDMNLSDGWIFDGESVCKHSAVAIVFPAEVRARTAIMHGCRPVSSFMEITRIEGAEVFELDRKPALDVLEQMLGFQLGTSSNHDLSLLATLGRKHGDPYASFNEKAYVNRLILRANRGSGSITIFEPDFEAGSLVQIMARDNGLMLESVKGGAEEVSSAVADRNIMMSLYIDCAGRASARSGAPEEEAEIALNETTMLGPFLGFYSGVEIAPVDKRSFPLDWTAVLTTLYYSL
jgi:hypothetical protein